MFSGLTQHHESHQRCTIQFENRSSSAVSKVCKEKNIRKLLKEYKIFQIAIRDKGQANKKNMARTNYKWYSLQPKANSILFDHTLQRRSCILGS